MTKVQKKYRPLKSEDVLSVYKKLQDEGIVYFSLTDQAVSKVESLVGNVNGSFYGVDSYPSPEIRAAAFFYFIIKDHAFTDGNKRTAVLTLVSHCEINNLDILFPSDELDALAIYIESQKTEGYQDFIKVLSDILFTDVYSREVAAEKEKAW